MHRCSATSRTRSGSQRASLLLAFGFVASQLLGAAHLSLVPHLICPEHGELIHVREAEIGTGVAARQTVDGEQFRGKSFRGTPGSAALDAHDHCLLSILRSGQLVLPKARGALVAPGTGISPFIVREAPARPSGIAIVLFAPKNSPPVLCA